MQEDKILEQSISLSNDNKEIDIWEKIKDERSKDEKLKDERSKGEKIKDERVDIVETIKKEEKKIHVEVLKQRDRPKKEKVQGEPKQVEKRKRLEDPVKALAQTARTLSKISASPPLIKFPNKEIVGMRRPNVILLKRVSPAPVPILVPVPIQSKITQNFHGPNDRPNIGPNANVRPNVRPIKPHLRNRHRIRFGIYRRSTQEARMITHDSKGKKSSHEILQWNLDLRNFLLYSNKHWKKRYPQFRANYQGDKTVGYALAKDIVDVPKQYKRLRSLSLLTETVLKSLPSKSFVIKETLGHSGSRVLCMYWDPVKKVYNDYLHHIDDIEEEQLIAYITKKLDLESAVIIEELLPFKAPAPPPDFKVYVVLGRPRLINVYFRLAEGRFEASYKPNWERIPIKELYEDLVALQYSDLPQTIPFELPSEKTRKRLLDIATKLAKAHDAKFVRYDFYVIDDRIILGEITPLCGGIRNNILKEKMLNLLFPTEIRQVFNYLRNQGI